MGASNKDKNETKKEQSQSAAFCAPNCCFIDLDSICSGSIFQWTVDDSSCDEDVHMIDRSSDTNDRNANSGNKAGKQKHQRSKIVTPNNNNNHNNNNIDDCSSAPSEDQLHNLNRRPKTRPLHKQKLNRSEYDHPPPVIALSRSSASNASSAASSTLDDDEMYTPPRTRRYAYGNMNVVNDGRPSSRGSLGGEDRDYAGLHEQLVNALFEDAQARHSYKQQQEERFLQEQQRLQKAAANRSAKGNTHNNTQNNTDKATKKSKQKSKKQKNEPQSSSYSTPKRKKNTHTLRPTTPSSNKSSSLRKPRTARRLTSTSSNNSSHTKSSAGSDILTPSSHKFKKSLSYKRRKVHAHPFPLLARRKSISSHGSSRGLFHSGHTGGGEHNSHSSTQNSNRSSSIAQSFLELNCSLQKDQGKGLPLGNAISARGRSEAMSKLGEKIDLLVEMETEGTWSNASLTRVPAKVFEGGMRSSSGGDGDVVETRSMLGVKLGFLSMKYGILVHWSRESGQAVLILLRKMCSESFINEKKKKKEKSRKKLLYGKGKKGGDGKPSGNSNVKSGDGVKNSCSFDPLCLGMDPIASCGL